MNSLVKLYEELRRLAREQRRRAVWDKELSYHQIDYFTGLADANDNAAKLLWAELESSGTNVDQELSLVDSQFKPTVVKFFCPRCGKEMWEMRSWDDVRRYTRGELDVSLVCSDCLLEEIRADRERENNPTKEMT